MHKVPGPVLHFEFFSHKQWYCILKQHFPVYGTMLEVTITLKSSNHKDVEGDES